MGIFDTYGTYDLPPMVWAYIFGGCLVALVIALRVTDLRNGRRARRRDAPHR